MFKWLPSSNKNSQEIQIKDSSDNSDDQHSTSSDDREDTQNTNTILKFLYKFSDS